MTDNFQTNIAFMPVIGTDNTSFTTFTRDLDNYDYGISGNASAARFVIPETGKIQKIYFHVEDGTPGTMITLELRDISGTQPGTTLLGSTTTAFRGKDIWHEATLSPPVSVNAGTNLFLVFGVPGSNTWTIRVSIGVTDQDYDVITGRRTTDGWASSDLSELDDHAALLRFTNGTVWGSPWIEKQLTLPSTKRWGVKIERSGTPFTVWAIRTFQTDMSGVTQITLHKGNSGPEGPIAATVSSDSVKNDSEVYLLDFPIEAGIDHRIVFEHSSSISVVNEGMGEPKTKFVRNAGRLGGRSYLTIEENGEWVDYRNAFPAIFVGISTLGE
ncbi:MAG: hypothetical protein ACXAC5_00285 [Promethearchaeota archaeon]|jgi:hypothetical protein